MFDFITVYLLLGIIFGVFLETVNHKYNKNKIDYVRMDMIQRSILIFAWPIFFVIFIYEFFKYLIYIKKKK